jgi:hypothetical protein
VETRFLQTKFYIPLTHPNLVSRPSLISKLNSGLDDTVLPNDWSRWIIPAAFIAGAIVRMPQMFVLRQRWPEKSWQQIVISAFG